jgi:hypothetical protein
MGSRGDGEQRKSNHKNNESYESHDWRMPFVDFMFRLFSGSASEFGPSDPIAKATIVVKVAIINVVPPKTASEFTTEGFAP